MNRRVRTGGAALAAALLAACTGPAPAARKAMPAGTLLLIGGGLDDDAGVVYGRLAALAAVPGPPRIVIATAATGPQDQEAIDKAEALRIWAPTVPVELKG